ncbi:hypothetical protein [Rhizobium leguminosarum]|uniref:hypothetical protein n=1 Tax=Rhizobium leguminosarum TaxID=384 RepID=UPI001030FFAF|nr:hypothetical protein [Rhizobium leguminosarum]TBE53738.1 hypothetical protein ELH04_04605 [Rhizobium leguminosarum]
MGENPANWKTAVKARYGHILQRYAVIGIGCNDCNIARLAQCDRTEESLKVYPRFVAGAKVMPGAGT